MRKPVFCICENKDADQLRGNILVFAIRIVQSLYYLNPKFQASSHLLWLYSLVCVGPGQRPRRPVFSQRGSYVNASIQVNALFFYRGLESQGDEVRKSINQNNGLIKFSR